MTTDLQSWTLPDPKKFGLKITDIFWTPFSITAETIFKIIIGLSPLLENIELRFWCLVVGFWGKIIYENHMLGHGLNWTCYSHRDSAPDSSAPL